MKRLLGATLLLVSLFVPTTMVVADEVTLKEKDHLLVVENAAFRLKIDPAVGGRITSFYLKAAEHEMVAGHGHNWGLFGDMFSQQSWPGELQGEPYEYEILQRGPDKVSIRLSRTASGYWRGYHAEVSGIRVEKTFTVKADSPNLRVHYKLINTTGRGKRPALWLQSFLAAGPDKRQNVYFRPSTRGVDVSWFDFERGTRHRRDDVRDPIAGWMATINPESKTGVVFFMDYNYLRWLYNCQCAWTTEWFYDKVMIPPGGSWETEVLFVPVTGMSGVSYASREIIMEAVPGKRSVKFTLRATEEPLGPVELAAALKDVDGQPLAGQKKISFAEVSLEPKTKVIEFAVDIDPQEGVIPFVLSGKGLEVTGKLVFSDRDIRTEILGGLELEPIFRLPVPPKQRDFRRPAHLEHRPGIPPRCLTVVGVYHRLYRLSEALERLGWDEIVARPSVGHWSGPALSNWPKCFERMMSLDVVALVNAESITLGLEGLEMLREFVHHGGGLLVLGGPFALGPGGYAGTSLAEILPVKNMHGFELTPVKDGRLRPQEGDAFSKELDWDAHPYCFWSHDLQVKPGARVVLWAGQRPLLVLGSYGKGNVAVFLTSPLGKAGKGQTPFWEWKDWPEYLTRVLKWLRSNG